MPAGAESEGDFIMNVVGILDLDELEEQAQNGEIRVPVSGGDSRGGGVGSDEGTDSSGPGGGGGLGGILGVEDGTDIASGGGKGSGMLGGMLGGISKMVVLLGAVVGLLLMLEPIQAALGGVLRILELAVVPFVAALTPVINSLTKLVTKALAFFRDPTQGIGKVIRQVVQSLGNAIIGALNQIPGVNVKPLSLTSEGKVGSGLQNNSGQMDRNSFEFMEEAFKSWLDPTSTTLWEVFQEPREPALSDEAKRQKNQDKSNYLEDFFSGNDRTM